MNAVERAVVFAIRLQLGRLFNLGWTRADIEDLVDETHADWFRL